jgi:hypothetical protein
MSSPLRRLTMVRISSKSAADTDASTSIGWP